MFEIILKDPGQTNDNPFKIKLDSGDLPPILFQDLFVIWMF